jgi:hypothetical protein
MRAACGYEKPMSIPVLTQVYDEVRRLSIAGSVVAPGDFRLKKLIPPLEAAGTKAPVFAKVAQSVTKLVESTEKTASEALLEVSTLVNAILYTQGETGLAGDFQPIETTDLGQQQTQASARVLKPLLEALSTTGSGRVEIIKDAHQRGSFKDLRLVKPALGGLDDVYPEIADFVAENILPLYGKAILPELKAKFNLKGRAGHVRRLALMHKLDPEGTREIVKQALEEGSKEMKVAAIECLGPDDLSYLLENIKAKAKDVREAALKALGRSGTSESIAALQETLTGSDIGLAIKPVQESKNPQLVKFVIDEADAQAARLKKSKDMKELAKQVERLLMLLECLRYRDDKVTDSFLTTWFARKNEFALIKSSPGGIDIQQRLVHIMAMGPPGAKKLLIENHAELSPDDLHHALIAAHASLKPAEVFELFSPYLTARVDEKKKGRDPAFAKREAIRDLLTSGWKFRYGFGLTAYDRAEAERQKELDPRWLDLAVEQKLVDLVQALARPGHAAANDFLSTAFDTELNKSKDLHDAGMILRTMVRVQHPAATDSLIAVLTKHAKSAWGWYWIAPLIVELPKEAAPKLEALLPTLPGKAVDQLIGYVTELRNRT